MSDGRRAISGAWRVKTIALRRSAAEASWRSHAGPAHGRHARLASALHPDAASSPVSALVLRDGQNASGLTCNVEPFTCCVEPDIRLRTWLTDALDDPTHAARLLDAARSTAVRALSDAARHGIEPLLLGRARPSAAAREDCRSASAALDPRRRAAAIAAGRGRRRLARRVSLRSRSRP